MSTWLHSLGGLQRLYQLLQNSSRHEEWIAFRVYAIIRDATLRKGNLNPGIGTKPIDNGFSEARAQDGSRVYFREINGNVEILGKSNKNNQDVVINEIIKIFGG